MARERFGLNFARTPARNEWKILSLKGVYNSLEDDSATLNNVWDEEHDALNMVTVVCNELDAELSDGFYYVIYLIADCTVLANKK